MIPLIRVWANAVYVTALGTCCQCKTVKAFFVNRGGKTVCGACDRGES